MPAPARIWLLRCANGLRAAREAAGSGAKSPSRTLGVGDVQDRAGLQERGGRGWRRPSISVVTSASGEEAEFALRRARRDRAVGGSWLAIVSFICVCSTIGCVTNDPFGPFALAANVTPSPSPPRPAELSSLLTSGALSSSTCPAFRLSPRRSEGEPHAHSFLAGDPRRTTTSPFTGSWWGLSTYHNESVESAHRQLRATG